MKILTFSVDFPVNQDTDSPGRPWQVVAMWSAYATMKSFVAASCIHKPLLRQQVTRGERILFSVCFVFLILWKAGSKEPGYTKTFYVIVILSRLTLSNREPE